MGNACNISGDPAMNDLTPSPSTPHRPDLAFLLSAGEKARKPYPWRKYDSCPHCGKRGCWEQTEKNGHCSLCGTWVFREILVGHDRTLSPYRPRKQNRTVTCCVPGCGAEFKTTSLHKEVRCPKCADRIRKQNNARYRKEARQKGKEC